MFLKYHEPEISHFPVRSLFGQGMYNMIKMDKNSKKKIFVAMSGGVDSSVAALLLKQQDYDLVGCFIKGWYPAGVICNWKEDRRDAMRVCAQLGIPFITVDAEKEYKKEVVDYMLNEYKIGRTPNPDIMCNKSVKFGVFLKKALAMGADYIATGHYVRREPKFPIINYQLSNNKKHIENLDIENSLKIVNCKLKIAKDTNKDQSYFLWTLTQEQLKYCLFPLGDLLKPEVRALAKKFNLSTADKEESQGVCFIGEFRMEDFLKKHIKPKKGKIITDKGDIIGEHQGLAFYTIGQRHGFGYGGGAGPYYVVDKDIKKNILIVAEKEKEQEFGEKKVEITDINWISGAAPALNKNYMARVRYRQPLEECKWQMANGKQQIVFKNPQRAVTPGQSLVLYKPSGEMLGGGIIA